MRVDAGRAAPRSVRAALATFTAVALVLAGSTARADAASHERAVALFEEGGKLLEAGHCDQAIPKLRESLEAESSVGARVALSACYEATDPVNAWRILKEAASLANANRDDRLQSIETRATTLEKTLPTIHVSVPAALLDEPAFELHMDGKPVDKSYLRSGVLVATAGAHQLEATAPMRHWSATVNADVKAPGQARVLMEPDACPARVDYTLPPPEPAGSSRRMLGLTIGGVGVAGIATGAVFGVIALNKRNEIQSACGGNMGSCAAPAGSLDLDRQSEKTTATVSTVAFIGGAVALVGGGLLYFTAPSATKTGQLRVGPQVGKKDASLTVMGAW
jgi:hypothetical protein